MLWVKLVRVIASVFVIALAFGTLGAVAYRSQPHDSSTARRGPSRLKLTAPRPRPVVQKTEAEKLAETLLNTGSDLFDAKDAQALAASYTEDGEIHLIDNQNGQYRDEIKSGQSEIEALYRDMFRNAPTIDSENRVEFARLVAPDVLVIHGRFRPNVGEPEMPFVQTRIKQRDEWRIRRILLFFFHP